MVSRLGLRTDEIAKVEFKEKVLFPDNANGLFQGFKSPIIFPSNQYTSNVWLTDNMFRDAEKFNADISNWDMSNVISIAGMFA